MDIYDAPVSARPVFHLAVIGRRLRTAWRYLTDLILGTDLKQRATISFLFWTAPVFALLAYVLLYCVQQNMLDKARLLVLAQCWGIFICFVYGVMRSGLNQSFNDPTLSLLQTCVAQTFMAGVYAFSGRVHSSTLLILALVMMFAMFNIKKRYTNIVCIYTVVLLGLTMLYKSGTDPLNYPAELEWINFALCATSLTLISRLTARLSDMRYRKKMQTRELELAYLHIQKMATRDELTGLCNRRHLKCLLDQHVERCARTGQNFYLAMLDLDHFKFINDTFGHHTGDEVLKNFSLCTRKLLRKTDTLGRWGGEEFVLILPETGNDQVLNGLSRLQSVLANTPMVLHPSLFITFSGGLTRYRPGENIEQTINRSDQLLYLAKKRGRNKIEHDDIGSVAELSCESV